MQKLKLLKLVRILVIFRLTRSIFNFFTEGSYGSNLWYPFSHYRPTLKFLFPMCNQKQEFFNGFICRKMIFLWKLHNTWWRHFYQNTISENEIPLLPWWWRSSTFRWRSRVLLPFEGSSCCSWWLRIRHQRPSFRQPWVRLGPLKYH